MHEGDVSADEVAIIAMALSRHFHKRRYDTIVSHPSEEAGVLLGKELVAAMGQTNEEMLKAGGLLAAQGLHPSSKGARLGLQRRIEDALIGRRHGDR